MDTRPSSLPPVHAPQTRFLRPDGKADFAALFAEFRRRLAEQSDRDQDEIARDLNYEIAAEQMLRGRA